MGHSTATCTAGTFQPYIGQLLRLVNVPGEPHFEMSVTVESVEDQSDSCGARSFSVFYTGDPGGKFQQGCLIVDHPDFDPEPVFFVRVLPPPPVAGQPPRAYYQTIFA